MLDKQRLILADMDTDALINLDNILRPKMSKYVPLDHDPTINSKLTAFLLLNDLEVFYGGAAGGAKAQPLKSTIQTPFGPRKMEDMQIGSQVCNPDGTIARVIGVYPQGVKKIYKINFTDDAYTYATEDHLWLVSFSSKPKKNEKYYLHNDENVVGRICTTEYLINHLEQQKVNNRNYYPLIPLTKPVIYTYPINKYITPMLLHPYLLGILLGDGCFTTHSNIIKYSFNDDEIAEKLYSLGYVINKDKDRLTWRVENIKDYIQKLALYGCLADTKFIPEIYKYASIKNRKELIQGLMDTDGYVDNRGHMSYTTISKQLAEDFRQIILSLGGKVTITNAIPNYTYKGEKLQGQRAYTIFFNTPINPELVYLPRKRQYTKYEFNGGVSELKRRMVSIEPAGEEECQCIRINHPNGLYLTDDFIVTHNTEGILMGALQYVDIPKYSAILFRRTFQELDMANSLMNRAMEWLHPYRKTKEVHWAEKSHRYTFPSGATLTFGHMEHENDKFNYKSAEFQYIGFDELTGFTESQYRFLFSRLRRVKNAPWVPLRMRSGSNPGGEGHFWVKKRFLENRNLYDAKFIPALMEDNPALDRDEYEKALTKLDAVEYEQMRWGNWEVSDKGPYFDRKDFKEISESEIPTGYIKWVRYWDRAATKVKPGTPESRKPKFTAGALMGEKEGNYYIKDVKRFRKDPAGNEKTITATAIFDGFDTDIVMEQEPGSLAIDLIDYYARKVLNNFHFQGNRVTGDKELRATPFSTAVKQGRVYIVKGSWNVEYYDELELFPNGRYKDQVDASSGAFNHLRTNINYTHIPIEVGSRNSLWVGV